MKILYIVRHGNAENASLSDFDRALTAVGLSEANRAGDYLADEPVCVQSIISSDAVRARTTAEQIAARLGKRDRLVLDHEIYDASLRDLLKVVQSLSDTVDVAVMVGHNPGLQDLVNTLAPIQIRGVALSTGSVVKVKLEIGAWAEARKGCGVLDFLLKHQGVI